jgi:hypothetical protein
MKRIVVLSIILFSVCALNAQKDTTFYRHEVKASIGESISSILWLQEGICYVNVSVAYLHRPLKWLWVGGNIITYLGEPLSYDWREYYPNGSFRDFSKSKIKIGVAIAPEIRFSYLNRKSVILYSALSAGVGWEDGYESKYHHYPRIFPYFHVTLFGISGNFGKNKNIFIGGESGIGFKGFCNIHAGYRF